MSEWFNQHWQEILAALGVGSGSGFLSKKLMDRESEKRMKSLEEKVSEIESKQELNHLRDLDFRDQAKTDKSFFYAWLQRVEEKLDKISEDIRK